MVRTYRYYIWNVLVHLSQCWCKVQTMTSALLTMVQRWSREWRMFASAVIYQLQVLVHYGCYIKRTYIESGISSKQCEHL